MGIESGDTIYDLNESWPLGPTDTRREGDNHLRLIKDLVKKTFLKGDIADIPAAGTADRLYFSQDEKVIYYDNGSSWVQFYPAAGGEVVTGDTTVTTDDVGKIFFADTTSNDITFTYPTEGDAGVGFYFYVVKIADANRVILEDDASAELERLAANEEGVMVCCDGTADGWYHLHKNAGNISFAASMSATQTGITEDVWTKLQFDTQDYDNGGVYDPTTNYRFTAPADGKYLLLAATESNLVGNEDAFLAFYKNGSITPYQVTSETGNNVNNNNNQLTINNILELSEGDYIEVYYKHDAGGGDHATAEFSYFMGCRIQ